MSRNTLQSRQYIDAEIHSQICQECRDTYLSAGGITDASLYLSLKATKRLPAWRHALQRLSRRLPVSDGQTLLVCNTKSFCALVLGISELEGAAHEINEILDRFLRTAISDVQSIIRKGLLHLRHTYGGNAIRVGFLELRNALTCKGVIRQPDGCKKLELANDGRSIHDREQHLSIASSPGRANFRAPRGNHKLLSANSVYSREAGDDAFASRARNEDSGAIVSGWLAKNTITTALTGPHIIKPEVLVTVHALASYISELPQNAVVILPIKNSGVPWLHDFMDEHVNVPDYKILHSPYISRIRLLTIQIQAMKQRQREPEKFNQTIYFEVDVAISENLDHLHLQLLKFSKQASGNLSETHRNALIFYMLSVELNWYWRPAIAQTYCIKIQEILNLYRGQLISDQYLPFIVMTLFWYAFGDVLLSRYTPIHTSLDWPMLLTMVDFESLPFSAPYQMVLRSCFGMYYKAYEIQSMMKLPASIRLMDQLRDAKSELLNILLVQEQIQNDIAAAVGDSVMLRQWMQAAETSLFDLVVLLDDLEDARAPVITKRILDSLDTMLQGHEQRVVKSSHSGQLIQIVVALLSAFRSAKDEGAEYWWDRVFKASYRIDASKTGRAAWYRAAMMRHDETQCILAVCHQFGGESIYT